jgi:uncharacterized protein (DUF4415 family)
MRSRKVIHDLVDGFFGRGTTDIAAPVREPSAAPNVRELVSIRIDRAVLDYFQEGGPGWQDRINDALRQVVNPKPIAAEGRRSDDD